MFYSLSSIHWFVRVPIVAFIVVLQYVFILCPVYIGLSALPMHARPDLVAQFTLMLPCVLQVDCSNTLYTVSCFIPAVFIPIISCHHKSVPLLCSHALPCGRPTVYRLPTPATIENQLPTIFSSSRHINYTTLHTAVLTPFYHKSIRRPTIRSPFYFVN